VDSVGLIEGIHPRDPIQEKWNQGGPALPGGFLVYRVEAPGVCIPQVRRRFHGHQDQHRGWSERLRLRENPQDIGLQSIGIETAQAVIAAGLEDQYRGVLSREDPVGPSQDSGGRLPAYARIDDPIGKPRGVDPLLQAGGP